MHSSVLVPSNMAAPGCVFGRTLSRSRSSSIQATSAVCRDPVLVVDVQRYTRDRGSSVYFPQAVFSGDDLYDITLTDHHCRLRVTLDPGLNRLMETNVLRPGSVLRHATFICGMAAQLPECSGASEHSYQLLSAEVTNGDGGLSRPDVDLLPWFGSEPAGPLRANRSVFLPLWNSTDYSGVEWREAPSSEEEDEEEDESEAAGGAASQAAARRPAITVAELRRAFLSGRQAVVRHELIVRIINKSHLMYYGKSDQNCDCPYKAAMEVCDHTGRVCVVLWNSVCVSWYRCLKPGDIISLRRYRVKQRYQADHDDIEISVNSRNPAAQIARIPESSVSPQFLPPLTPHNFCSSQDLLACPPGSVCDVIGLLTFVGRPERIRSRDDRGAVLLEYRWLRLEDGTSSKPIMVKLFSTSQPECHHRLHPCSVVVCTQLRLQAATGGRYLSNTTYTQVYCTGLGHHSEMSYRKLRPVRLFLQWLKTQDDEQVLRRAVIGGYFVYPPPPISMETYMKDQRGEPGFLLGAELQREMERLCYRERRIFCIQATVTMVTYSRRGEEDRCLFWTEHPWSRCPASPPNSTPPHIHLPSTPHSLPMPLSPSSSSLPPMSPPSSISHLMPHPLERSARTPWKRKLLQTDTPRKRRPSVTSRPEQSKTVVLFQASMEFLDDATADDDHDDDDASSFVTAPPPPDFLPVADDTLPMRFDHAHREEQADAVGMGGRVLATRNFDSTLKDYYLLRLRALSDGMLVDAVFLPHGAAPPDDHHANTWLSILSHGAFSPHTPPPSPADLIGMAAQLANQRLACVLDACHLGGAVTEVILSRGFRL
ncbi:RPA-related protein RADX isoform X2 [Antennarius striatus]|uniref:RPA-related protein RADX isoform X2 n=1 Tax=Antennarius striatus TaxID=241820 RepID=UPI0035B06CDA